ncbi:hypothetical protein AB0M45_31235 [Nocardia sp. NPDC051787]|uniref:hypothetical protein n=1 Tax=Nocardia sp. NPDC051787 TaxID=3155415 RepID=UPI00344171D5
MSAVLHVPLDSRASVAELLRDGDRAREKLLIANCYISWIAGLGGASRRGRSVIAWITVAVFLVFSLAGCDREHRHAEPTQVEVTSAAGIDFCPENAFGSHHDGCLPHAAHFAIASTVTRDDHPPTLRVLPARIPLLDAESDRPVVLEERGPPPSAARLVVGGRGVLTQFCICRR